MSIVHENIKRHQGVRNITEICVQHKKEHGARPSLVGIKGEEKKAVVNARAAWDRALMARSTVIREAIANDICKISEDGLVVRR